MFSLIGLDDSSVSSKGSEETNKMNVEPTVQPVGPRVQPDVQPDPAPSSRTPVRESQETPNETTRNQKARLAEGVSARVTGTVALIASEYNVSSEDVLRHLNTFGSPEAVVEQAQSQNLDVLDAIRKAYLGSVELMKAIEVLAGEWSVSTGYFFSLGIDWPAIYQEAKVKKIDLLLLMRQAHAQKIDLTPKTASKPKPKLSDLQEQRKQAFKHQPTSEQLAGERQSAAEKKKAAARAKTVEKKRTGSSLQTTLAAQAGFSTDSGEDDDSKSITEQMGDTVGGDY